MKSTVKKTVSVAVASAMILSMTGCSFLDKSKDEVLEAVESYAKNLASCNVSKIAKGTVDDFEDDQEDWEEKLTFSSGDLYDSDEAAALSAIADTISYEIDEESVEATKKSGEGSVSVTFSMADYEALLDEEITKVDDFVDAVEDADKTEIEITIEFEKDDEEWLCSNYDEVFEDLYAFTDETYEFKVPFAESVNGVIWYGGNYDGTYTNATYIEMDLDYTYSEDTDYSEIYYVIEYNGQEIKTQSGTPYVYLWNDDPGVTLDESGYYLAAGTYTITFYDVDDSVIITETATVSVEEEVLEIEAELYWWFKDYDSTNSDPVYTNTTEIDGQLQYSGTIRNYSDIYFEIEYNGEIIYTESGTTDAWVYASEIDNCPMDPSGSYMAEGVYTITFYDGTGTMLASDSCTVVVE